MSTSEMSEGPEEKPEEKPKAVDKVLLKEEKVGSALED